MFKQKELKLKGVQDCLACMQDDRKIVFYDGYCALCNNIVRFILKRDKIKFFHFSSLQSEFALYHVPVRLRENYDSIILYSDGKYLLKSEAVFTIIRHIGGIYKLLLSFNVLPESLNDRIYDIIARNRNNFFKRMDHCPMPPAEHSERFLSSANKKIQ